MVQHNRKQAHKTPYIQEPPLLCPPHDYKIRLSSWSTLSIRNVPLLSLTAMVAHAACWAALDISPLNGLEMHPQAAGGTLCGPGGGALALLWRLGEEGVSGFVCAVRLFSGLKVVELMGFKVEGGVGFEDLYRARKSDQRGLRPFRCTHRSGWPPRINGACIGVGCGSSTLA